MKNEEDFFEQEPKKCPHCTKGSLYFVPIMPFHGIWKCSNKDCKSNWE